MKKVAVSVVFYVDVDEYITTTQVKAAVKNNLEQLAGENSANAKIASLLVFDHIDEADAVS